MEKYDIWESRVHVLICSRGMHVVLSKHILSAVLKFGYVIWSYELICCLYVWQLDFAINALMSLNMVVTLLVALVLENTVPGSRQERGVYIWSKPEDINTDPSSLEDYSLPRKFSRCLCRSNCLGVWCLANYSISS